MPRPPRFFVLSSTLALLLLCFPLRSGALSVTATVDKPEIGMGGSVSLTTKVRPDKGGDLAGYRVIPFVNGKRWGAIEVTDNRGQSTHHLPLPNPGRAVIEVLVEEPASRGPEPQWIWAPSSPESATQYFQQSFDWKGDLESAVLFVAADDGATVHLNGEELGTVSGWSTTTRFENLGPHLTPEDNVLSIEARSAGGLAGLLVRLEARDTPGVALLVSDGQWHRFDRAPYGWPYAAEEDAQHVKVLSGVAWSPWRTQMEDWPGLNDRSYDIAGTPLPLNLAGPDLSAPVTVEVFRRALVRPAGDPDHRVGIQFEPWFTPRNANWGSTPAVPLTGLYWSWNPDVTRQQMIWLIESGIDFLVVDWTNHLWDKAHWDERGDHTNEIIHATTMLLESLATLRDEGNPVPTVVLYGGLNNGPATTVSAVNECMSWIHHTYVRNPRFAGLFELYQDKPLFLAHSGGGPNWKDATGASRLDESLFTVRYQSFMHEFNDHAAHGFWSWMDATLTPVPTLFEGQPEALTVSSAFFAGTGWKGEGAHSRKGGWTLTESFKSAFQHRPRFLQIHQFQEFAGQWEGGGYGPDRDLYVDSYSVELSDDIEPVSLTAHAYRGEGGWGFLYLNLLRALVDCYHQATPETTVVALDQPGFGQRVSGASLPLRWTWVGKTPSGFELSVNGRKQSFPAEATEAVIELSALPAGPLEIVLTALDTQTRYALSHTEASLPSDNPLPAQAATTLSYTP
ncbi:MAG: hypothetical protein JNK74_03830 [Candidatus Hydrogenedentes bacterium]|nr:hypothetical protein [Candidatus Hydrogenedentota bacterium]